MKFNLPIYEDRTRQFLKASKKAFVVVFFFLVSCSSFGQISAPGGGILPQHSVSLYTPTCGSGPQYSIQPGVVNVNSTSNYRWQYKNGSGTWVCITPGANTINSFSYNVTGAEYNHTTTPGPLVFTNPNIGLNGLVIRIVIYDGTILTNCTFPGTVYNGDASSVNHTISVSGTPCGGTGSCTAHITGLYFNKLSDNSHLTITNGSTFSPNQITNLYNLEVSTTGTVGSVKFTITGPTSSSNIENTTPYNSPGTGSGAWTGAVGSYSVNVKAYSGASATGSICHDTTINFTLANDCDCVNGAGNLLTNGSFENVATGWSVSGGTLTFGSANTYVMCGTYNGFLNWSSGTAKVWQDVTTGIFAGSVVTFKGYAGTHTPGISCSPKLSLIFLNSSNAVISQSDVTVTRNVDGAINYLELYSITATAPAGTVKVRVQASIGCNTLKVDGFCLTVSANCPGGGTWNLNLPNGTLGTSQAYTVNGKTITAYGFNNGSPGTPTALYGKNDGGDETGLGINSNSDFEIDVNHFVQLDLNQIIAAGAASGTMSIGSMQTGEPAKVFGSNSLGTIGTLLMTVPVTLNNTPFPMPGFPAYRYISVQAGAAAPANVLLQQVSFSCPTLGCIGDRVWKDDNRNGIQDANEVGIPGVTMELLNASGTVIGTTTTDSSGIYHFCSLPAGNYSVRVTPPANYNSSPKSQGADTTVDSDFDPVTFKTGTVTLGPGQIRTDIDAGLFMVINLSGNVWHDVNAMTDNLVNNSGAAQIPPAAAIPVGLRVYLVNANTGLIERSTLVSSATGTFSFTNINANTLYRVYLSSVSYPVGANESVFPVVTIIPNGWDHTGQKNANPPNISTGSDSINDGKLTVPVGVNNVINVNFGIRTTGGEVEIG